MTKRVYRTAQGKIVDLGALQLQNENVRAVGNMAVNARGDLIDGWNRPIESRTKQVGRQYDKQTTNVSDEEVTTKPQSRATAPKTAKSAKSEVPPTPEDFDDNFDKNSAVPAEGGLAAAIARARKIQQEPITSTKSGITKI